MGFVGSMLGTSGGAGGTGFSSPTGTNQGQLDSAYNNTQNAIRQQQDFVNALSQQNGVQNQQGVFDQLKNISQGQGPNPAQAMLNQATGQNIASQAALMAGQRGSSSNAGLIARQAAMQGGNLQQQAAGQGATMQANQSMNAINTMGNLATQQVNQQQAGLSQLGQQGLSQQSNLLGLQNGINSANASMTSERMKQQSGMFGNIMGGVGSALSMFADGGQIPRQQYADAGLVQNGSYGAIDYNDPAAKQLMALGQPSGPMAPGAAASPNSASPMTQAPPIQTVAQNTLLDPTPGGAPKGPQSAVGRFFQGMNKSSGNPNDTPKIGSQDYFNSGQAGKDLGTSLRNFFGGDKKDSVYNLSDKNQKEQYANADVAMGAFAREANPYDESYQGPKTEALEKMGSEEMMPASNADSRMGSAEGGKVPAMVSPGEKYLKPKDVKKVEKGANPMEVGETIPGKPRVGGAKNDYANDTVPKTLESGGIVLPRSVTKSKDPGKAASDFVNAILAKQGKLPKRK